MPEGFTYSCIREEAWLIEAALYCVITGRTPSRGLTEILGRLHEGLKDYLEGDPRGYASLSSTSHVTPTPQAGMGTDDAYRHCLCCRYQPDD